MTKTCPTCGRGITRSTEQNRRYWKLVQLLVDKPVKGEKYDKKDWHLYLRSRFLGCEEHKLPNGKVVVEPIETHDLDVHAFNEYMGEVEAWAAEHGVFLDS